MFNTKNSNQSNGLLKAICLFALIFLIPYSCLSATEQKKTVCLNMIIKDEIDVICRCLQSVKPLIDHWIIVDTGSTDGTQKAVQEFMKDIPGELYERPWKNFEHNRNEALELARGKSDYILFIDADEVFEREPNFKLPTLDKDCYYIPTLFGGMKYDRVGLIKSTVAYTWKGVLHEVLYAPPGHHQSEGRLAGIANVPRTDGARSKDPKKYEKDALVLETALKDDPNNSRNVFYLAQSYKDAGNYPKSIENYKKRVAMGGWDQEIFWSLLQIAALEELQKVSAEQIVQNYFQAFQYHSTRAEPLYYLSKYYRSQDNFAACYAISKLALSVPFPNEKLFVEKWVYDWGLLLEHSVAAYWLGKYEECKTLSEKILALKDLPENVRTCVERNREFAIGKLH